MRKIFFIIFFLNIFVSCISANALGASSAIWNNIRVDDKNLTVYKIYKDNHGIIWLGTNSGLYLYDGVHAHAVGNNQLFGFQVYDILAKDNVLYIASNNGLYVYNYDNNSFSLSGIQGFSELRCLMLVNDKLWVGGLDGLYTMSISTGEMKNITHSLPHKSVYSLLNDSRGIIYVGTYSGMSRWNNKNKKFQKLNINIDGADMSNGFVNCLHESLDASKILMGTEGHMCSLDVESGKWSDVTSLRGYTIKSIQTNSKGILFIGTDDGVFEMNDSNIFHYTHDARFPMSLAGNEVWCVYADGQDNVWIGHDKGLSVASNDKQFKTLKLSALTNKPEGNDIYAILRDTRGNLWLGGNNGLLMIDKNQNTYFFRHNNAPGSISHNRIRNLFEDSQHNLWVATDGGINRYDYDKRQFSHYLLTDIHGKHNANWIYSICERDHTIWIGSYLGGIHGIAIDRLSANGGTIISDNAVNTTSPYIGNRKIEFANDFINSFLIDKYGNYWILHFRSNKLTCVKGNGETIYYDIQKITGGYPTHILQDRIGRIWCAFRGGVVVFDRNNHKTVTFPSTLVDESVLSIGEVNDAIWISTQSNIWSVDEKKLTAELLPIPQNSFTSLFYDEHTQRVFLGGVDEVVEVDPQSMFNNMSESKVKLILRPEGNGSYDMSNFRKTNKKFTIAYGGSLELILGTLNYNRDYSNRFAYKISKSDSDSLGNWVILPAGTNNLSISDLSMGDHVVLVKVMGSTAEPSIINITVTRPWFLSWIAIIVYVCLILILAYSIFYYSKSRVQRAMKDKLRRETVENIERKLQFLTNISHDLKTPLSMIIGPISVMKEQIEDEEKRASLELVYDNAMKLNNMIHKTLELNRVNANTEDLLILSIFNVVDFCKSIFASFEENNPSRHFVFHTFYPNITIEADAVKLESVFSNLFSNACKYSQEGATISCGIELRGDEVEISVSDDGMGIAKKDQPFVFQRMFRSPATSKLREGNGIGLYLIKKYLEMMGGNISMYSEEGQGTSFIVTLHVSKDMQKHFSTLSQKDIEQHTKILIVEDNQQIAVFIKNLLSKEYACMIAENGRTGLSIANTFLPDIIILDEMMPIMTGMEMLRQMKRYPRLASIPVIMLTAKDDNRTEVDSVKLGVDVFMSKPFEPQILIERIHQIIDKRKIIAQDLRIQAITETKPVEAESVVEKQLAKIASIIEDNIKDPNLNVNMVCEISGIQNKQLYRMIKKYMNITPLEYIHNVRLQKAAMLIEQQRFSVSEIAYMVGFSTPSYFTKCFQKYYGVNPSQYKGENITRVLKG